MVGDRCGTTTCLFLTDICNAGVRYLYCTIQQSTMTRYKLRTLYCSTTYCLHRTRSTTVLVHHWCVLAFHCDLLSEELTNHKKVHFTQPTWTQDAHKFDSHPPIVPQKKTLSGLSTVNIDPCLFLKKPVPSLTTILLAIPCSFPSSSSLSY